MCWVTKDVPIFKIAEKDIVVYKLVLYNLSTGSYMCFSPFHPKFKYIKNELSKKVCLDVEEQFNIYCINKGYHSFLTANRAVDLYQCLRIAHDFSRYGVGEFVIPKGSMFYQNENEEIVSSNIMFKKLNKIENYLK